MMMKKILTAIGVLALLAANDAVTVTSLEAALTHQSFGSATIHIYQEWFPVGLTCGSVGLTGQAAQNGLPCVDKYGDWTGYTAPGGTSATAQATLGSIAPYQTLLQYEATTTYPSAAITLGSYQNTTSTTSTQMSVANGGFSIGDPCIVGFNNVPTSTSFGEDAAITAVSSTAGLATATVTLWNGASSAITLNTTSSITGGSSTLRVVCTHYN